MHRLLVFKLHGLDPYKQLIASNLRFVQIADMLGNLVIVKIAQHGTQTEKIAKKTKRFRDSLPKAKESIKPKPRVNNDDDV